MRNLTILLAMLFATSLASTAEELPPERVLFVTNGLFCSEEAQLRAVLDHMESNHKQTPNPLPEGCGRFLASQPLPMVVTPLYWYESGDAQVLVSRLVFIGNGWTQYGWVAVRRLDTSL